MLRRKRSESIFGGVFGKWVRVIEGVLGFHIPHLICGWRPVTLQQHFTIFCQLHKHAALHIAVQAGELLEGEIQIGKETRAVAPLALQEDKRFEFSKRDFLA